jgi:hypothetical protein
MSNETRRIPVTEERWNELTELKPPEKTYDELLGDLIREHRQRQLAERVRDIRAADASELTPLDDL